MKKIIISLFLLLSISLFADWYVPLNQVPQAVIATAKRTYPQAEIWAVELEHFNVYKVKMNNMMELYIDKSGQLLGQEWDD